MPARILDPEAVQRSEDGVKSTYKPLTGKENPEGNFVTDNNVKTIIYFCFFFNLYLEK